MALALLLSLTARQTVSVIVYCPLVGAAASSRLLSPARLQLCPHGLLDVCQSEADNTSVRSSPGSSMWTSELSGVTSDHRSRHNAASDLQRTGQRTA